MPVRWSASENVRWKAKVPGDGYSSPVVAGNSVYVTTAYLSHGAGLWHQVGDYLVCFLALLVSASALVPLLARRSDGGPNEGGLARPRISTLLVRPFSS
jgi:hypothetical protein